jgi:urease accessory protein
MQLFLYCMTFADAFFFPMPTHAGVSRIQSLAAGVAHPLTGADHIAVMTIVGVWSVLAGGRAIWVWPITFVAAMLGGFAAASLGLQLSFVEPTICASIIVLALLVVLGVSGPLWIGAAIIGLFAFFHGHAHGTEAGTVSLIPFAVGFTFSTAALHAAGIGLGLCARGLMRGIVLRATGGLAALIGLFGMGGLI